MRKLGENLDLPQTSRVNPVAWHSTYIKSNSHMMAITNSHTHKRRKRVWDPLFCFVRNAGSRNKQYIRETSSFTRLGIGSLLEKRNLFIRVPGHGDGHCINADHILRHGDGVAMDNPEMWIPWRWSGNGLEKPTVLNRHQKQREKIFKLPQTGFPGLLKLLLIENSFRLQYYSFGFVHVSRCKIRSLYSGLGLQGRHA